MDASFSSPPSCTPPPLPRASARAGLRVALLIDHRLQETALLTFRLRVIIRSQQPVSRQARGNCRCRSLLPQKRRSAARKGSWKRDDVRFEAKLYLLLHVYCLLTKLPRPRDKNERTCLRVKLPPAHRPPSTRHSETATCPPPTIYQTQWNCHLSTAHHLPDTVKLPPVHRPPSTRHSETATCPPPTIYQTRWNCHLSTAHHLPDTVKLPPVHRPPSTRHGRGFINCPFNVERQSGKLWIPIFIVCDAYV